MNKVVTVFGSSMPVEGEQEYEDALQLGRLLGENGFSVCSGGYRGTMDAVSKGATEKGAEAIGITVDLFNATPSPFLTKEIECDSLFERIGKLIETGDAYVVLPGGTGTLLEFAVIWEHFNKGLTERKPFASLGNIWKNIAINIDERMKFEKRETGMLKSFLEVEDCANYIIKNLK